LDKLNEYEQPDNRQGNAGEDSSAKAVPEGLRFDHTKDMYQPIAQSQHTTGQQAQDQACTINVKAAKLIVTSTDAATKYLFKL